MKRERERGKREEREREREQRRERRERGERERGESGSEWETELFTISASLTDLFFLGTATIVYTDFVE
jgi:hypothetical protein